MARLFCIILVFLSPGAVAWGQGAAQPPVANTPPSANNSNAQLMQYLLRWEQEMHKIQTLVAQLKYVEKDKTFETTKTLLGMARFKKAGVGANAVSLASLELRKEGRSELEKRFVATGNYLYQVLFESKEIRAFELPKPKPGQVAEDSFMSFLFGMKAEEAMKRYNMRLVKEDQYYFYVEIFPRNPADRADFQRARVVFNKHNYLPRQLWFEQPNGSEVTWDIPKIEPNVQIDRAEFDPPRAPQGWKFIQEPLAQQGQPRIVRPNN
ncbi:MAG: hypothetical protein EXR99_00395 [Gemmataceae bacterium]|nr:hypothetical protein [Gemmataceae bacterium]